jgi:hypothetical protein
VFFASIAGLEHEQVRVLRHTLCVCILNGFQMWCPSPMLVRPETDTIGLVKSKSTMLRGQFERKAYPVSGLTVSESFQQLARQ